MIRLCSEFFFLSHNETLSCFLSTEAVHYLPIICKIGWTVRLLQWLTSLQSCNVFSLKQGDDLGLEQGSLCYSDVFAMTFGFGLDPQCRKLLGYPQAQFLLPGICEYFSKWSHCSTSLLLLWKLMLKLDEKSGSHLHSAMYLRWWVAVNTGVQRGWTWNPNGKDTGEPLPSETVTCNYAGDGSITALLSVRARVRTWQVQYSVVMLLWVLTKWKEGRVLMTW